MKNQVLIEGKVVYIKQHNNHTFFAIENENFDSENNKTRLMKINCAAFNKQITLHQDQMIRVVGKINA
jgi:hypothetical protein